MRSQNQELRLQYQDAQNQIKTEEDRKYEKEKELEESKQEAEKAKKYNTKMLIIALVSAGIALASLVATILIAVL